MAATIGTIGKVEAITHDAHEPHKTHRITSEVRRIYTAAEQFDQTQKTTHMHHSFDTNHYCSPLLLYGSYERRVGECRELQPSRFGVERTTCWSS